MNLIFSRASVRTFDGRKVEPEKVELLLRAAMAAPSACNQQPWEFVVAAGQDALAKLAECSPYAGCLRQAPLGIAVCMRTEGLRAPDYTQIDASAATENLLLEAVDLGLGAVWLGIAPGRERMEVRVTSFGFKHGGGWRQSGRCWACRRPSSPSAWWPAAIRTNPLSRQTATTPHGSTMKSGELPEFTC